LIDRHFGRPDQRPLGLTPGSIGAILKRISIGSLGRTRDRQATELGQGAPGDN
jgi:hypothetical protein